MVTPASLYILRYSTYLLIGTDRRHFVIASAAAFWAATCSGVSGARPPRAAPYPPDAGAPPASGAAAPRPAPLAAPPRAAGIGDPAHCSIGSECDSQRL